jgi:hypothetical protein
LPGLFGTLGLVLPGLVVFELPEQFSFSIRTDVTRRCCAPVSAPLMPDVPAVDEVLRRELRDVRRSGTTVPITSTCWPIWPSSAEPSRTYDPLLDPLLALLPDALFSM